MSEHRKVIAMSLMLFLFLPFVLALGAPVLIGAWTSGVKLYNFLRKREVAQTKALTTSVCVIAASLFVLTAPYFVLGVAGYAAVLGVFVFYVAVGLPHTLRVLKFLKRELDGNPDNDVPIEDASAPAAGTTDATKGK